MDLDLAITNLAHRNGDGGRDNLGLAVGKNSDNSGNNDLSAYGLLAAVAGTIAGFGNDLDGLTLRRPVAVVQVVKVARQALVENSRGTESQGTIGAGREASGDEGTRLRRTIELKLEVGGDVASAILGILEYTILESHNKSVGAITAALLLKS